VRVVDGKQLVPQVLPGENIGEFGRNTWSAVGPDYRSAGTYRWIDNETIEQTIVESNLAIQLGMVTRKRVVVDARRLELQVSQTSEERAKILPPPVAGTIRHIDTLVLSRFERIGSL